MWVWLSFESKETDKINNTIEKKNEMGELKKTQKDSY